MTTDLLNSLSPNFHLNSRLPEQPYYNLDYRILLLPVWATLRNRRQQRRRYTKLVLKFIMAFGSPESAGIPRLAHVVFTSKVLLNRTATKSLSSTRRLDHELQLPLLCTALSALSLVPRPPPLIFSALFVLQVTIAAVEAWEQG